MKVSCTLFLLLQTTMLIFEIQRVSLWLVQLVRWETGPLKTLSPFRQITSLSGLVASLSSRRSLHTAHISSLFVVTINIPENSNSVEYKYIRKVGDAITWEQDPNRSINVGTDAVSIDDVWR